MDKFIEINNKLKANRNKLGDGCFKDDDEEKEVYLKTAFRNLRLIWEDAKKEITDPGELGIIKSYIKDDFELGIFYMPTSMDLTKYAELFKELGVR